jgi:hypothetical protein
VWGVGGSPNSFEIGIIMFAVLTSPGSILESYDNPFWEN